MLIVEVRVIVLFKGLLDLQETTARDEPGDVIAKFRPLSVQSLHRRVFIIGFPVEVVEVLEDGVIFGENSLLMESLIENIDLVFTLGMVIEGVCYRCHQGTRESPSETSGLNHCRAPEVHFESAFVQIKELRRIYAQESTNQVPVLLSLFFLSHYDINNLRIFKTLD